MSRLTLRLPESLHDQLDAQAEAEGVSLNHFIVYSLTRAVTVGDLEAQAHRFDKLLTRVPAARAEKALGKLLADREPSPKRKAPHGASTLRPRSATPRPPRASR